MTQQGDGKQVRYTKSGEPITDELVEQYAAEIESGEWIRREDLTVQHRVGPGRPWTTDEPRDQRVIMRLSKSERARLDALAEQAGVSRSDYMRERLGLTA